MNPENLSEKLRDKLKTIETSHPDIYIAYQMKEELRVILHMKCREVAEKELDQWFEKEAVCGIEHFSCEATNTTIKSLIATARGFHNLDKMFALIYLRCSDLTVPLNNRYQPSQKKIAELRELQNARKEASMEKKRESIHAF